MLKIGQNWGKTANYPPNAQQRSAPLVQTFIVMLLRFAAMLTRYRRFFLPEIDFFFRER